MVTQLPDRLVAWALIVASGCGGGPQVSANGVSESSVVGHVGRRIEGALYDISTTKPCVRPPVVPDLRSRASSQRVPTVSPLHPTITWILPDSSRLTFVWAPNARRYDVFHLGGGYEAVGRVDRCEALFAGRLLEYDTWRYTRATSTDTVYVARLVVSSSPHRGLEVVAISYSFAARTAVFNVLANLTLDDQ